MPNPVLSAAVARVGRAVQPPADPADGRLVGRWVAGRDGEAFAELVRRHGPLVLAVCRRVAGDPHLADDAFQAAFLVLARRAHVVKPRGAVRGWLLGVAVRCGREARAAAARRRAREVPMAAVPDRPAPPVPEPDADALRALDEEVGRLPDHLRAAVVLCELDGLSRKDAADRLGVPEGTLSSRLAKARKLLAGRLRGRGMTAAAYGLGATAVPANLRAAAVRLAVGPEVPSAAVADLTRRVGGIMMLMKLTAAAAGAVLLAAGAAGLVAPGRIAAAGPPAAADPPRPAQVVRRPPAPKPPREGVILVTSFAAGRPAELFKPDGTPVREPTFGAADLPMGAVLSRDGKRVAVLSFYPPTPRNAVVPANQPPKLPLWARGGLHVFDLAAEDGSPGPTVDNLYSPRVAWAPDGTKLYGSEIDPDKADAPVEDGEAAPVVSWLYDLKTKAKTPLALPPGHGVADVSPDGKSLLTVTSGYRATPPRAYLVPVATLRPAPVTDKPLNGMRFSPDGKRVLGGRSTKLDDGRETQGLVVVDLTDKSETPVRTPKEVVRVTRACWAPDGKRIAYDWMEAVPPPPGAPVAAGFGPGPPVCHAARVSTAAPDGSDDKVIIRREYNQSITGLDWR